MPDIKILEELRTFTIKPIEIFEFTNNPEPIPFPGVDLGQAIVGLVQDISEWGSQVIDRGAQFVNNIVDKGINVLTEPIKIVIIAASIAGGLILLLITLLGVTVLQQPQTLHL